MTPVIIAIDKATADIAATSDPAISQYIWATHGTCRKCSAVICTTPAPSDVLIFRRTYITNCHVCQLVAEPNWQRPA